MTGVDRTADNGLSNKGLPAAHPQQHRIAVIIPHLNTPLLLVRCLESVVGQQLDRGTAEVVVVDNGSHTPLDAVQAQFPQVRFLYEAEPGPGPARNCGIAAVSAPGIAFIDADCRAAAGWLQCAADAIEVDPFRCVVGGDVRIDFGNTAHLSGIEAYEAVFGFRQKMYIERKRFSVTANLAMARTVHGVVGPFGGIDIAEDLDWGQRAAAAGYRVRYLAAMRVYHPARSDFAALTRKWQRHIRHDWNAHRAARRPAWHWRLRAAAMVASVPLELGRVLTSDRLTGVANRIRGIEILARIRWFRAAEMLRVMRAPAEVGDIVWNRHA